MLFSATFLDTNGIYDNLHDQHKMALVRETAGSSDVLVYTNKCALRHIPEGGYFHS